MKIANPGDSWASGNTGPIRLDEGGEDGNYDPTCSPGSSGASEYRENIEDGSECHYAVNDEIRTKTGNMKGPTCKAFENRPGANDDTFDQVFGEPDLQGVYTAFDRLHARFGIVPIVSVPEGASGFSTNVTITGFIAVYIHGACDGGGCDRNDPACMVVTPVKSFIYQSSVEFAEGSFLDEKNPLRTMKLIN